MELEPIEPETAVELYLADREPELASITLKSHRSRLGFFVQWCEEQGIDNLNELTGRKINEYRLWRRNTGDLAPASENCQMDTLRVFVRWLESIDGAPKDLHEKVRSPSVGRDEGSRDVMIDVDDAEEVLSYLETYYYATLDHVTISLLWHTMMRRGAAHSLDIEDYHPEDGCLEIRHRPETGTPLKNGTRGERLVALSGWLCNLLDDWLRDRRPDVVDENGREPLLATSQGRIGKIDHRQVLLPLDTSLCVRRWVSTRPGSVVVRSGRERARFQVPVERQCSSVPTREYYIPPQRGCPRDGRRGTG